MKRTISIFLIALMLLSAAPLSGLVDADLSGLFGVKAKAYSVGEIVELGSYPQTRVTDGSLISSLNSAAGVWQSYGYYSGTNNSANGAMTAKDYMQYCDVTFNGAKYRGVKFTQYRPKYTGYGASADNSYQDNNGYAAGTTYWFRYEPLQWRVLDQYTGLAMCETIIDSQPVNNYALQESGKYYGDAGKTHYANNYAESSLREWLNDAFYNAAFAQEEQKEIAPATIDNSAYSTSYSNYDSVSTTDNVFLLSYREAANPVYNFSNEINAQDPERQANGTDYAKCQGLTVAPNGNSPWWLRSAGYSSASVSNVHADGCLFYHDYAYYTYYGIRPAITLNLALPFENYKTEKKAEVDAMLQNAGSDACPGLFRKAKDNIDAIIFDSRKTMDENNQAVDAVVTALANSSFDHDYSDPGTITFASDYSYATEVFTCKNCGSKYKLTDSKLDFVVTKAATCAADTVGKYKAEFKRPAVLGGGTDSKLSKEVTLSGTATGKHKFAWVIDKQATCSSDGAKHEVCSVCKAKGTKAVIAKASGVKISATSFTYNGKVQKPTLTVKDSAGKTIAASNYTAKWSNANSKAVGKYTVKITFKGNYSGTKTLTYKIIPRQVTGLKTVSVAKDSIKLSWTSLAEAKRYKVEYSTDGKKWTTFDAVSRNNVTVDSLKAGKKYQFRVTALNADETISGKTSTVLKTETLTAAPKISKLTSTKSKTATVTWGKVTGAKSYTVYTSTDGKTFKAVKTGVTGTSATLTKLTAGKKIYVKVIAVNAYGKNSAASAVKSVTVKK